MAKLLKKNVSYVVVGLLNCLTVETDNFLLLLVTREQ